MILDGAVGTLQHVHAWGDREIRRPGYLPAAGDPPSHLHYDLWIGPSPMHPYNPGYFGGCLAWNMYWDFGSGQIGDMGSHTMDLAWYGIDATLPTTAEAFGEKFNPDVTPVDMTATFEHPANDWRPAIKVTWYQGAHGVERKKKDPFRNGHGALFVGDKAMLAAGFDNHKLLPLEEGGSLDHYTPRPESEQIPRMGGFQEQWVNACKGDLKCACDFKYSGDAIEQMLLGLVAYRVGKKLEYDHQLRKAIKKAAPDAEEVISYQMPAYKYHGMVAYFAVRTNHYGLYLMPYVLEVFKDRLAGYKLSKSTIQIPFDKPLPEGLVTEIIDFAVNDNRQKAELKKEAKKAKDRLKGKR